MRISIFVYFIVLFIGLWWIMKPKRKQYLACPKTGIVEVDPDEKTHCGECARKYIAGGMRNLIKLMPIDRSLFEYARKRDIREMLIDQGYAVIFTTNNEMRKEFFQVVEEVKQELASEGIIIKNEI